MKKGYLVLLIIISLTLTGCKAKEGKDDSKKVLMDTYQKADDNTITKCIADYNIKEKKVVYNFCINEDKTLYSYSNGGIAKFDKEDAAYNIMYATYLQIEDELSNPYEGFNTFEFKPSELK